MVSSVAGYSFALLIILQPYAITSMTNSASNVLITVVSTLRITGLYQSCPKLSVCATIYVARHEAECTPSRTDHPAIGDAIDEDGSGFISVHEANHFLKRIPNGWSVPQWFA